MGVVAVLQRKMFVTEFLQNIVIQGYRTPTQLMYIPSIFFKKPRRTGDNQKEEK
ncbi:MAG: hypothetical protein Q4E62_03115 [Sutterellaceae bacterium]|nr:hypothetical protein [Sutterellaceae bacterium]